MIKRRLLYLSDLRPVHDGYAGGYSVITEGLCTGLTEIGQDVKCLAMTYNGQPHNLNFSVIPMLDPSFLGVQLQDIILGWMPDALVVALDIPWQIDIFAEIRSPIKYVSIVPVEGEPILRRWAEGLSGVDKIFTLSEFGVKALANAGLRSKLIHVAHTVGNGLAKPEQVSDIRSKIGLDGKFVTLKIADNHARKNWAHTIKYWVKWSEDKPDSVLYAVTRDTGIGWNLSELFEYLGGVRKSGINIWEWPNGRQIRLLSDIGRKDLLWVQNFCDILLMDTGNEGLGMPILDAFSMGLPVVGMNHTAISELLADGRGILFDTGYEYTDTFGNVNRYYPDYDTWSAAMTQAYTDRKLLDEMAVKAFNWIKQRSWAKAAQELVESI